MMHGQVEEVTRMLSKDGVLTGKFLVQVILGMTKFREIPDIHVCRGRKIFVVVECSRPHCWLCGTTGHLSKNVSRPKTNASASYIQEGSDERQDRRVH